MSSDLMGYFCLILYLNRGWFFLNRFTILVSNKIGNLILISNKTGDLALWVLWALYGLWLTIAPINIAHHVALVRFVMKRVQVAVQSILELPVFLVFQFYATLCLLNLTGCWASRCLDAPGPSERFTLRS